MELIGNIGYWIGSVGILVFTLAFLLSVRWYTDILGRVIASVFAVISAVLLMSVARMLEVDLPGGLFLWRAVLFVLFGASVWSAVVVFMWAQFWAPRRQPPRPERMLDHSDHTNREASK